LNKLKKTLLISITLLLSISSTALASAQSLPNTNQPPTSSLHEQNIASLKSKGFTDDLISQLGDDVDVVSNAITNNNLNQTQIKNFTDGVIKAKTYKDSSIKKEINNGSVILDNGTQLSVPDLYSQRLISGKEKNDVAASYTVSTGAAYDVTSSSGYSKVSSSVTLPSTSITATRDVPYFLGGIYTASSGTDLGVYYSSGNWYTYIEMGGINWASSSSGWVSSSVAISPTTHPTLYLVYKVSAADQVEIDVYDGSSYSLISSLSYYAPSRGFNTAGTGVSMKSGNSIAYTSGTGQLNDLSHILGAQWYNTYIYNNTTTALWSSSYTSARGKGGTSDEQSTVSVSTTSYDYNYSVSINFNKP
jgi:hypothetical protein